ncbi:hypothetical protein OG292_36570 [Streptomyces sp. NBC_01511]
MTAAPPQGRVRTLRFPPEWGATRRAGGRDVSFAELARVAKPAVGREE